MNQLNATNGTNTGECRRKGMRAGTVAAIAAAAAITLSSCSGGEKQVHASEPAVTVGVTKVFKKTLGRTITLSSELVPFQEIDVYAKESGYVKKLMVDYGTHVKTGQTMAILEIPELEAQLQEDLAEIKNAANQVVRAEHVLGRYQAQYKVRHLEYTRLNGVSESQPGLVAQQEVDDAQGKDLSAAAQVDAAQAALEAAQSQLSVSKARLVHDQTLYDYAKITAPFSGVVTERYANLGTLVQAGTTSSTQAMPIVKLSEDDLYRLVIPVPESYVKYIKVGDPVDVRVPSLNRTFPGKVARFSQGVREDTRTMHTEVDVANKTGSLLEGMYAEAVLTLEQRDDVPTVPLQAVSRTGGKVTVLIVDTNDKIQERSITLGIQSASEAEVTSGLHSGEQVVVSDRGGLKVGEKVNPQAVQMIGYKDNNQE